MLEIRVLGPLEARSNGVALRLGTPKQQAVLAALALNPGHTVPVDDLVDELWPFNPPASAVANVRTYAANLRRLFAAVGTGEVIVRLRAGYRLDVSPEQLDLLTFDRWRSAAESAYDTGDLTAAADHLERAYALGRGPVLAGLDHGTRTAARSQGLDEEQAAVAERLAEVRLAMGRPADAVTLLVQHVRRYPLRERGYALLMRAQRDVGDPAAALATYDAARSTLSDELGVEPGPELRQLRAEVRDGGTTVARSWLPRAVIDFTGRETMVSRLAATSEHGNVWLVDGMAGVGKTTLAVHVARATAPSFPDGQLFLDLRGHDEGEPVTPMAALATLLRQLGVPGARVPADLDGRSALWRDELAARRCVVVLDNAGSTDQITPLLPSGTGSLVLVTSRRRLLGSAGVRLASLPLLDPAEAVDLLAKVAGADRIVAEPQAAAELARLCGYLPLALRLAGARLAHRRGWRVADLVQRLTTESTVLTELVAEDRSVAAIFSTSYERVSPAARRVFRLLGVPTAVDFTAPAVAALAGCELGFAERILEELVDRHLVEEPEAGRYRVHDLLRLYARSLAETRETDAERDRCRAEIHDHYVSVAAALTLGNGYVIVDRHLGGWSPRRPDLVDAAARAGWFGTERRNLIAAIHDTAEAGRHGYAWRLALAMWRFLYEHGLWDDIEETQAAALRASQKAGDRIGSALCHNYMGSVYSLSRPEAAVAHLQQAITLLDTPDDEVEVLTCRMNLSNVLLELGRADEALALARAAMAGVRIRSVRTEMRQLSNLGGCLFVLGDYRESLRLHRLHLFQARANGDLGQVARAMANLGKVRSVLGDSHAAMRLLRASVALKDRFGLPFGVAEALNDLGRTYRDLGRLAEAEQHHRIALRMVGDGGYSNLRAEVLNELGETLRVRGDRSASAVHADALKIATGSGHLLQQGRALVGLAACGGPDAARRYLERALAIYTKMNIPARHDVARRLDDLRERPLATAS